MSAFTRMAALAAALALVAPAAPGAAQPAPAAPAGKPAPTASKPAPTATTPPAKPRAGALAMPSIDTFTLANGLQVAVMHRDGAPVVSVQVWYHAGSKDEPRNRRGSAHMFEHMMFKGTEHVPPEAHAQQINRLGGYVNAQTTEDSTHYFQLLPAEYLDFALQLEAERMRNLLFREDMIKTEREVVKEEIRQGENNPLQVAVLKFLETAFTVHPYAWTAGGTIADLDATSPADLKKFYDTYYVPNNALLVVVGNVTTDQVKASAEKWFGAVPKAPPPPRPADAAPEPTQTQARRLTAPEPSQLGVVITGYKIPAAKHPDVYALQVLSIILGGGESSRLMQRIKAADPKTKAPLGLAAGTQILVHEHPGLLLVVGAFGDASKAGPVEAALQGELDKMIQKGPTADELRKAKNQIQAAFVYGLENADGIAQQIGESWILTGDPTQWIRDLDAFEKLTAADIQKAAKTYFDPKAATTVVVLPPTAPAP